MARNHSRLFTLLVTLLLVSAVTLPGAVAGASVEDQADDLTLQVVQDHETGQVLVSLDDNTTDEVNATLEVSGDAYDGNGTYEFPANGSLTLVAPTEAAKVTLDAETNDSRNVSGSFDLVPLEDSLSVGVTQTADGVGITVTQYGDPVEGATVNVTADEETDYSGLGEYQTDANGSVLLDNPDLPVNVTVNATDGDLTATTEAQLEGAGLGIDLAQDDSFNATVTVTRGETPIEDATVNISADGPYDGNGTYQTDSNGSVDLPAPAAPRNVTVNASTDSLTAEETFHLDAAQLSLSVSQDADYNVVIDVTYGGEGAGGANVSVEGDYAYAGDYTTDENGSVVLNPPANDTTINVTAEYADMTVTATDVAIEANASEGQSGFAKALVRYIQFIKFEEIEGPPGQLISAFVHEHNPSSADDDAGRPEDAGPKNKVTVTSGNQSGSHGPPDWAASNNSTATSSDDQGPPHTPPGHDKDKNKGNNGHGNPHEDSHDDEASEGDE